MTMMGTLFEHAPLLVIKYAVNAIDVARPGHIIALSASLAF
jgi:hypothetical protein